MMILTNSWHYLMNKRALRKQSHLPLPWLTWALSIMLLIIYYLQTIHPTMTAEYILSPGLISLQHEYYRILTSTFIHGYWDHVLSNVTGLLLLGWRVERLLGHWRFAVIYLISSILGALFSLIYLPDAEFLGASGGIHGIEVLTLVLFITLFKNKIARAFLAWWQLLYALLTLVSVPIGLILLQYLPDSIDTSVNNYSHLGGIIASALIFLILGPPKTLGKLKFKTRIFAAILFTLLVVYLISNFPT